ncbi:pseudouridine synthase [Streptococcaceae bacterium ESL0687]|nr:pseudouridine synthase [Streptococcaceae bacterium ESL0687]
MRIDELLIKTQEINKKEARQAIKKGLVLIDGHTAYKISQNVDSRVQEVTYNGCLIDFWPHSYYMLNKPVQTVCANKDDKHPTVFDLLGDTSQKDLYSVGRLDFWTTGLLLLTDNGPLGRRMLNPENHVDKIYQVKTKEALSPDDVIAFKEGVTIDGDVRLKEAYLDLKSTHEAQVQISEGKNRQVRKMFLARGKLVLELKRIKFGPLNLDPDLAVGYFRELTEEEIRRLIPYFD